MTNIFKIFIVLPIIIIGALSFVFQSSIAEIQNQQWLVNCPYPISGGVASISSIEPIVNNQVNYTVSHDTNSTTYNLSVFECKLDPLSSDPRGASVIVFTSNNDWFSNTFGTMAYIQESISTFLAKIQPALTVAYLYVNAPAVATGLDFFAFFNSILLGLFGLGMFMVFKPGGT